MNRVQKVLKEYVLKASLSFSLEETPISLMEYRMKLEQLSHINSSLKSKSLQIIKDEIKFLKTRSVF